MSGREEGFLSRWSRRKRGVLPEPGPGPELEAPPPIAAPEALPEPPEEAFDAASLPPVESLTGASDFTAFLRPGVPAPLRQAALRRAWTLDPAIRDFIGPADYAWDYNAPDGVPGFALQLGGDVTRMLAQAIGALDDLAVPQGEQEEAAPAEPAPPVVLAAAVPAPEAIEVAAAAEEAPAPAAPVPPRRHGRAVPV